MDEHQQNRRTAADRVFMESLNQLQDILAPDPQASESGFESADSLRTTSPTNAKIWEEAAADLEAFFSDKEPSTGMTVNDPC
jgi:hypothetical protein